MSYRVNEVFFSLQGEGHCVGTACVFVRFSGCNLTCSRETEGFDCDTEFVSGRPLEASAVASEAERTLPAPISRGDVGVIFTGGEPTLQLDVALLDAVAKAGFRDLRLETNGTTPLKDESMRERLWISCSPHTAEHTLRIGAVDELRYVRRAGQGIPRPSLKAGHLFVSPACGPDGFDAEDIAWCVRLVKENPEWRLSMQQHKLWSVR